MKLLLFLCGIFFGILSGLFPSIHINFISAVFISLTSSNWFYLPMAIAYSFFNVFPLFLLQFPDENSPVFLNTIQKMIKRGKMWEALLFTFIGSFIGGLNAIIIGFVISKLNVMFFKMFTLPFLIFIFLYLLRYNLIIGLIYSVFGLIILNRNFNQPLFHFFSLGFALYNFVFFNEKNHSANKFKFSKSQLKLKQLKFFKKITIELIYYYFLFFFASLLAIIFLFYPGVSASLSLIFLMKFYSIFEKNKDLQRLYLYTLGIVNTSAYVITPFLLKYNVKRNYVAIIISKTKVQPLETVIILILSLLLSFLLSIAFLSFITKINLNFRKLNFVILFVTLVMSYHFDSIYGIIIGFISMLLLRLVVIKNIPRYVMMISIVSKIMFSYLV